MSKIIHRLNVVHECIYCGKHATNILLTKDESYSLTSRNYEAMIALGFTPCKEIKCLRQREKLGL